MSSIKRRPSLLGALLWICMGVLFLLWNFGVGPDLWHFMGRYWPILLILLGLAKVIDYYMHRDSASIRLGEVVGILLLLVLGSIVTRVSRSHMGEVLGDMRIPIGNTSMRPNQWFGTSYSYTDEVNLPAASPIQLKIENANGSVTLSPGSDREVRVRLRKTVYATEESRAKDIAAQIKLQTGPEGRAEATSLVIKTNRDELSSSEYRFKTDMELFVPPKCNIEVHNAFGEVRAANLEGRLNLTTSQDLLDVRDCTGDFTLSNRFYESRIANLTGNLKVVARGRVVIETVRGDVDVRNEYSPVEIRDVDGRVTVSNSDSSIALDGVSKPVVVEARGTQLTARNLRDSLKATTSYRNVQISDVAAQVWLDSRYSTVSLRGVKGDVEITSNSDRINADGLGGLFRVKAERSGVRANGIDGPLDIQTTLKDVIVNNFKGSCSISNEYADVSLSTPLLAKAGATVRNRNGGIDVFLPEGASFQIEAVARHGRVVSDYAGLEPSQASNDVTTLKGAAKAGAPQVMLETDYGDIHIRTRGADTENLPESPPERRDRRERTTFRSRVAG